LRWPTWFCGVGLDSRGTLRRLFEVVSRVVHYLDMQYSNPNSGFPILWFLILVVGAGALVFVLRRFEPPQTAATGEKLEFVHLKPLTGGSQELTTEGLNGKVTLLNVWGPWCGPCRAELPHLAAIEQQNSGHQDFQLVLLTYAGGFRSGQPYLQNVDSLRSQTQHFLTGKDWTVRTHYDPNGRSLAAIDQLVGIRGVPLTLVVDRNRTVRGVWRGYSRSSVREMENLVIELLEERS